MAGQGTSKQGWGRVDRGRAEHCIRGEGLEMEGQVSLSDSVQVFQRSLKCFVFQYVKILLF